MALVEHPRVAGAPLGRPQLATVAAHRGVDRGITPLDGRLLGHGLEPVSVGRAPDRLLLGRGEDAGS